MLDYLIIGQGITGTMLAWELLSRGYKIKLVDKYDVSSPSSIAAGVINPVTGRRMVKTWMADTLLPKAYESYQNLSNTLDFECFTQMPIYRFTNSTRDLNDWLAKANEEPLIRPMTQDEVVPGAPAGGVIILGGGIVHMQKLIEASRKLWEKSGILQKASFQINELRITEQHVEWRNHIATKMVFCEGFHASANPMFHHLPFVLTKGELLTIEHHSLPEDKILMK